MRKQTHSRAFSLIELLVVIAIIGIMSVFVMSNLTATAGKANIDEAANDIVSFLRKARQNSVTVLEHPERPGLYPSYGVHFDVNTGDTVILYADCTPDDDNSGSIDLVNDDFHFKNSECSGKGKVEEFQLKGGAEITDIAVSSVDAGDPSTLTEFNILYIRPEPSIWFAGKNTGPMQSIDVAEVRITVSDAAGSEDRVILINSVGLIVIE